MIAGGASLAPKTMVVRGGRDDRAQQPAPSMDRADHRRAENQELRVGVRVVARIEQVALGRIADREVHVLARSIDARKRLLVQQASHPVLLGHSLQRDHRQLLMVGRDVSVLEHRRQLELSRRHLVVPRLGRNPELEQLALALEHEGEHALGNRAKVMVLELLALGRRRSEQRAPGGEQVRPRKIEVPVDQKIFLLAAGEGDDVGWIHVSEEFQNSLRLLVQRLHRTQQWRLLVERLAGPRDKRGWNTKSRAVRILKDISGTGDVPHRVAARLEGVADAAVGEARRVRLTLRQGLAREFGDRATVAIGRQEAVVLLGGEPGQRIKHVRIVRRAFGHRPVAHRRRDRVRDRRVEARSRLYRLHQRLEHRLGEPLFHRRLAEDVRTE